MAAIHTYHKTAAPGFVVGTTDALKISGPYPHLDVSGGDDKVGTGALIHIRRAIHAGGDDVEGAVL